MNNHKTINYIKNIKKIYKGAYKGIKIYYKNMKNLYPTIIIILMK